MEKLNKSNELCAALNTIGILLILLIVFNCPPNTRDGEAINTLLYIAVFVMFFTTTLIMYVNVMSKADKTNMSILASSILIPIASYLYFSNIHELKCFY